MGGIKGNNRVHGNICTTPGAAYAKKSKLQMLIPSELCGLLIYNRNRGMFSLGNFLSYFGLSGAHPDITKPSSIS